MAFLRNADAGGDLARGLALAVLRAAAGLPAEWTRLALEVRDADPLVGAPQPRLLQATAHV